MRKGKWPPISGRARARTRRREVPNAARRECPHTPSWSTGLFRASRERDLVRPPRLRVDRERALAHRAYVLANARHDCEARLPQLPSSCPPEVRFAAPRARVTTILRAWRAECRRIRYFAAHPENHNPRRVMPALSPSLAHGLAPPGGTPSITSPHAGGGTNHAHPQLLPDSQPVGSAAPCPVPPVRGLARAPGSAARRRRTCGQRHPRGSSRLTFHSPATSRTQTDRSRPPRAGGVDRHSRPTSGGLQYTLRTEHRITRSP